MSIHWGPSRDDYVESHCGQWWITPNYWGCTRPQSYTLKRKMNGAWKTLSSFCSTQREAKEDAERLLESESESRKKKRS